MKFIIIFLVLINLSLTKLLPNSFLILNHYWVSILCILLCMLLCFLYMHIGIIKQGTSSFIRYFLLYMFFMLAIESVYTVYKYNYSLYDCWTSLARFCFVFFAYPIYCLLINKKWTLDKFIKVIVWCTFFSYLVRIGISYIEGVKGIIIYPSIALECAPVNFYRNGVLRINPPCFGIIFIPLAMYLFYAVNNKIEKLTYLLMIIMAVYYSYTIHAARSALIYNLICIVIMLLVKKRNSGKQLIFVICAFIAVWIICQTSIPDKFIRIIASFSVNSDEAYSTLARLNAKDYFYNWFKQNILFGIGALKETDLIVPGHYGNIADIGFLGNIFRFGLFGMILYILLFFRYIIVTLKFYITYKNNIKYTNYLILLVGITVSNILFSLNIDCFYEIFAFSVPFSIAIVEYIKAERLFNVKEKK